MDNEKFENIDSLVEILDKYKNDIDFIKSKLDSLSRAKLNLIKNNELCDFGLVLSNFELKKELLTNDYNTKNKFLEIIINRLYLDLCYLQSLCINIENILFDLRIVIERKLDKNIFKIKNIKIGDFRDILDIIKNSYNIVNNYLEKFRKKIEDLNLEIGSEISTSINNNSFFIQYKKLALEKYKIYNLINTSISFYTNICKEYLQVFGKDKYDIFLTAVFNNNLKHLDEGVNTVKKENYYEEVIIDNIPNSVFMEKNKDKKESDIDTKPENKYSFELSTSHENKTIKKQDEKIKLPIKAKKK